MPRGLGLATATISATFFPHCEHRIRCARAASVAERLAILASASGSIWREAPHGQVTRTRKFPPSASSSFLIWGSTRTGAWCGAAVYACARAPSECSWRRHRTPI